MEAASVVSRTCWLTSSTTSSSVRVGYGDQRADHRGWQHARRRLAVKTRAVTEVVADSLNSTPVDITWEIVVGSIAGATPFVVAGIEFSKRINAQRNCAVCKGSGLVRREKYYFRCPRCGTTLNFSIAAGNLRQLKMMSLLGPMFEYVGDGGCLGISCRCAPCLNADYRYMFPQEDSYLGSHGNGFSLAEYCTQQHSPPKSMKRIIL